MYMPRYFTIYKPFQVLSQFSSSLGKQTLTNYFNVPSTVYPVGRLDYDSEGLLILTDDATINHGLLNPAHKHEREYWVQVDGIITAEAITTLQQGVTISIDGRQFKTAPAQASIFHDAPVVPERNPPIRFRKNVPDSWYSLTLTEGKNRQVRRMSAQVGFPVLRLIRTRIEHVGLGGLQPGEMKEWNKHELYRALFG